MKKIKLGTVAQDVNTTMEVTPVQKLKGLYYRAVVVIDGQRNNFKT